MNQENTNAATPGDFERAQQDKMIEDSLSKIGRKILVMSGKGGVGKSTVAGYVALLLSAKGHKVGLLDVDLHGPTIPHLMNVQGGLDIPEEGVVRPYRFSDKLSIVSLEMVLGDKDTAVIWRGPLKISAIRQFISDIDWGDLDYLIVDSPPGTGDEPLTVAQTIPDAEALIVTTPQEISLADVRKSINFCRQVKMKIIGVVENMGGFVCPHCGEKISIFGSGGGKRMAAQMDVPLIGEIPLDTEMVEMGDKGRLDSLMEKADLEINKAYKQIVERVVKG
ncbi:MAG: Mrp/NBP35 family ATP-binding protein [Deltaproteobacteria bacterium]|nr:Mrp/NBP35 family ATP-binding protein [Deltaproteobacteria bacterium]MBW2117172.1 Mrp/NBP35 family ATP-binding protein [Deltaproteobacteria bacterium]MBW2343582.1 Mrp/NBP35 family ATP-binding protein [Deltaproteobacteria bacterium]